MALILTHVHTAHQYKIQIKRPWVYKELDKEKIRWEMGDLYQAFPGIESKNQQNWRAINIFLKKTKKKDKYLQIYKSSKEHKDNKPLPWSILVKQKDHSCQLQHKQQINLKCNLKSPNNNLSLRCRLLLLRLLSCLSLIFTGNSSFRTWPAAEGDHAVTETTS